MKLKNNNIKLLRIITDMNNLIDDRNMHICIFKNIEHKLSIGYISSDPSQYQSIKLNEANVYIAKDIYYKDFINSINIDNFTEHVRSFNGLKYYISNYEYEIEQQ